MTFALNALMDEMADVLREFSGLSVFARPVATLVPPAGVVAYPERITYDATYGNGLTRVTGLPVILVAGGKVGDVGTRDLISGWAEGSGSRSIKGHCEGRAWTSVADLTVTDVEIDVVSIAGVDYLAALFSADAIGGS